MQREDRRAGEVVSMLYNLKRGKDDDAIGWLDVFPEWDKRPSETEEQMMAAMQMWATVTSDLTS